MILGAPPVAPKMPTSQAVFDVLDESTNGIYITKSCLFVRICKYVRVCCLFVCWFVGWLVAWLVGWFVGWLVD